MTTEKQRKANQANALLSIGPKTEKGKAVVSSNAMKHGIFTQDLIVSSAIGKENADEYNELLGNLEECLIPQNQMESLLIEKIAIDFWRLRRVLRYEAGSIGKHHETLFRGFYTYGKKNNAKLEMEIAHDRQYITWVDLYVECLEREEVDFDQPTWQGANIEGDILNDFSLIAQSMDTLSYHEKENIRYGDYSFEKLREILKENGYFEKKKISKKLVELYAKERQRTEKEIAVLEREIQENNEADKLNTMLGTIPEDENTDKILKYERSLQKSIFQNLLLLKKLQEIF